MAASPKKKVTIVTKKKTSASLASPEGSPPPGSKKGASKGLLDLQRLLDVPPGVAEQAREVWMAGIGALSTVEEAGRAVFDELVRKGEHWERESRQKLLGAKDQASAAADRARTAAQEIGRTPGRLAAEAEAQIQRLVEEAVEGVLHRIGVPTHEEVRDLIRRVEALSAKVDALTARLQAADALPRTPAAIAEAPGPAAPRYTVTPADGGWAVQREGSKRAASTHPRKAEAIAAARELARKHAPSVLAIHRQDGSLQDETAYEG